jgi:hypothetical protein
MWSLLNALPIFKPTVTKPPTQIDSVYPLLIRSESTSSTSSSPERNVKLATPPQGKTPFCCPNHQIPSSACPTSHNLTLFLRALTLRHQELQHANTISSKTFFQPLIKADLSRTSRSPIIIELEISTKLDSVRRIFAQRYFVPRQGLQRTDIEMYPEGAFYEISLKEVERIRGSPGMWDFFKKDEATRDRVAWYCEKCSGGYWVRVILRGESVSVFA